MSSSSPHTRPRLPPTTSCPVNDTHPHPVRPETEILPTDRHRLIEAWLRFETIHPFVDGNGRAGCVLIHLVLRRRGLSERVTAPEVFDAFGALERCLASPEHVTRSPHRPVPRG
ncbi:Fic family protein [Nocardia lasii]|uniref:Fic family protein n=1 Tax=Nocardia lasii TaxID=1616107 RepID=A0ABW1JSL6_9NOCA